MAVTEYTYTKNVNVRVLRDEINADGMIAPKVVDHIIAVDTALSVWMSDSLTGGEQNALDTVVTDHTNPADPSPGNTIAGSGAPSDYSGADGDCCIDPDTQMLYKKTAGAWDAGTALGGGSELDDQEADSQSTFSTTSATFVDITTMTLTTVNTQNLSYMIFFSSDVWHAAESEGIDIQIVVDGVAVAASFRTWESYDGSVVPTRKNIMSTMALVANLANAKVIKVQARSSTGSASLGNKTLMIRGIG